MANLKTTTARKTTAALKASTAGSNSADRFTAADAARYREMGRKSAQGKLDALFAFMGDVQSGKLDADDHAKMAAAAYAQGSTNDVKAGAQATMSAAFKKCAHKAVLAIGIDKFRKACGDALATGKYTKAKIGKDAFDAHKAVAMRIVEAFDAGKPVKAIDEAFFAKSTRKTGNNNNAAGGKTEAERARTSIQNAVKKLTPSKLDAKQQAVIASFYKLVGIKLEAVK